MSNVATIGTFGQRVETIMKKIIKEWAEYPEATHPLSRQELKQTLQEKNPARFNTIEENWEGGRLWRSSTKLILDVAYKVDFLFQNRPEDNYWGIDFVLHPDCGGSWGHVEKKEDQIASLKQRGLYEAIAVEKMAVVMVKPPNEGLAFVDEETRLGEIISDVDGLFAGLEDSNTFLTTMEVDARE